MNIFVICSKRFYDKIPGIKEHLENDGHSITLPNSYDDVGAEDRYRNLGREDHAKWKGEMFRHSESVISNHDAVLVLNFKKGEMENYVGGATFLEMYDAFRLGKKIFLFNEIPEGILKDELVGFAPIVIEGDLSKIV